MSELLEFVRQVVVENGGVAEAGSADGGLQVLVPEEIRAGLGFSAQLMTITDEGIASQKEGQIAIGYGTELLERVISLALDKGKTAAIRMPEQPSRKPMDKTLERQLKFLNATYKLLSEQKGFCDYWLWSFSAIIEADERYEDACHVCISSNRVACEDLSEMIHLHAAEWDELRVQAGEFSTKQLETLYLTTVDRALARIDARLADFKETVARHYARDAKRIHEYFDDLHQEMEQEITSRGLKGEPLRIRRDKQIMLKKEAAAKLAGLEEKYRLRLTNTPRALLLARLPVIRCELSIKRRKNERCISAIYNMLSRRIDPFACEACGADTQKPGFCDTELHLLCEVCLSKAGGRGTPDCPRCLGNGPPEEVEGIFKRRGIRSHRPMEDGS